MIKEKVSQGRKKNRNWESGITHCYHNESSSCGKSRMFFLFNSIRKTKAPNNRQRSCLWGVAIANEIPLRGLRFKVARNRSQIDHSAFAYFCVESGCEGKRNILYARKARNLWYTIADEWRRKPGRNVCTALNRKYASSLLLDKFEEWCGCLI